MWRKDTSIRFVIFASLYSLVTPNMNGNLKLKDVIFIVLRNCTHFIKIPLKYEYLFIRVLLYSWDKLRLGQGQGQVITIAHPCLYFNCSLINTLWPGDAISRHRSGSSLAHVIACCLKAPNHRLNQSWLTEAHWYIAEGTFKHNDVIKWKHFRRNCPFVRGFYRCRWIPVTKASDAEFWWHHCHVHYIMFENYTLGNIATIPVDRWVLTGAVGQGKNKWSPVTTTFALYYKMIVVFFPGFDRFIPGFDRFIPANILVTGTPPSPYNPNAH